MFFTLFYARAVVLRPIATIIKSTSCFIRYKFKSEVWVQRYKKVFNVTKLLILFLYLCRAIIK